MCWRSGKDCEADGGRNLCDRGTVKSLSAMGKTVRSEGHYQALLLSKLRLKHQQDISITPVKTVGKETLFYS